jgi:hypothetical protein
VHTCALEGRELMQKDCEFEANLGYVARSCFKKESQAQWFKPVVLATKEAEIGRIVV